MQVLFSILEYGHRVYSIAWHTGTWYYCATPGSQSTSRIWVIQLAFYFLTTRFCFSFLVYVCWLSCLRKRVRWRHTVFIHPFWIVPELEAIETGEKSNIINIFLLHSKFFFSPFFLTDFFFLHLKLSSSFPLTLLIHILWVITLYHRPILYPGPRIHLWRWGKGRKKKRKVLLVNVCSTKQYQDYFPDHHASTY